MLDLFNWLLGFVSGIIVIIFGFILGKKDSVKQIRDVLESNKIFFETIVAVLLAIMAITLTINSNQIAVYETNLIEMENQPIIKFDLDYSDFENDILTISNIGTPLKDFECNDMIFLEISYSDESNEYKYAFIPISGYYSYCFETGNLTGNLIKFEKRYYDLKENSGNYKDIQIAENDYLEFVQKSNSSGDIRILRFVKIKYKDIFENIHEEIYFIIPYGFGHKLSEEDGKSICDFYNSFYYSEQLDISELSPDILHEKWLMNNDKSKEILSIIVKYY